MHRAWAAVAIIALLCSTGCDTKQPIDAGRQTISVSVRANVLVDVWQVWDVWADTDGDGVPDTKTNFHECRPTQTRVNATVAWPFSAELSLIRAGTTEEIVVLSTASAPDPFTNLTPYDTTIRSLLPNLPPQDPFYFLDGRSITSSNRDYLESCTNLGSQLEDPNLLGRPQPFSVDVNQGDTIVFRARKQITMDAFPYNQVIALSTPVVMSSSYFVDGASVTPNGNTSTGSVEGGGFTASVRLQ